MFQIPLRRDGGWDPFVEMVILRKKKIGLRMGLTKLVFAGMIMGKFCPCVEKWMKDLWRCIM